MIRPVLPLIVIAAIGFAVFAWARRTPASTDDGGGAGGVRRFFLYLGAFVALIVSAIGLTQLLERVFVDVSAEDMAGTLAMVVVGVPTFVVLARWIWRSLLTSPAERDSLGWTLYSSLTLVATLSTATGGLIATAISLIRDGELDGSTTALFLVWAAVWALHWAAWARVLPGRLPRVHLWGASIAGLAMTAGAIGTLLFLVFEQLFAAANTVAVSGDGDTALEAIVVGAAGLALWLWHWLRHGSRLTESTGWRFVVMVVGVLGGLLAFLIGAAGSIFLILQWFIGDPEAATASAHFVDMAGPLASMIVGLAVWWYHRVLLGPGAGRARTEMDRAYDYLLTGVAVSAVASGIVVLILAMLDALTAGGTARAGASDTDAVLVAITMVLVGLPLWVVTWRRVATVVARDQEEELASPARRTFLFSMFGIAGAVSFGALIRLAVVAFEMMLGERATTTAEDLRVPIALLVVAGAVAAYHFMVYRNERELTVRRRRRDVLLVCSNDLDLDRIAAGAHVKVRVLRRTDGVPSADVESVIGAITASDGDDLVVIADADGVRVVPCVSV